jgi:hypothetical protein
MVTNWEETRKMNPEHYLVSADMSHIRCVDERQATDPTNGVQIPGGIYGIVDAVKVLANVTEDEAWTMVRESQIPIDAHIDDHHGAQGCGYASKIENKPHAVLAQESVAAQERLDRVQKAGGSVLHYVGEHHPTHATINYRSGVTLDPSIASRDGLGIFNCDAWAVTPIATRLGLDPQRMEDHIVRMFKATVTELTGITDFHQFQ